MKACVALFRGINVGGRNSLPMKELVGILEDLGCRDVRTYIQSGNVVMKCDGRSVGTLPKKIAAAIERQRGFEPHVLLLTAEDLEAAIDDNPFPEAESEPKSVHVFFLEDEPKSPDRAALDALRTDTERYWLDGKRFYLHAPDGIGRSKLAQGAEKLLGVPATARNWRTVLKIAEMVDTDDD